MRSLPLVCAALAFPLLAGIAAPAHAVVIPFTDVYDPADITLTVGGTASHSFTHDITDSIDVATDTILSGTLAIVLSDTTGAEDAQFRFDLGSFVSQGNVPNAATTFTFNIANSYGSTLLISSLQADGKLDVTVQVGQQGGPPSNLIFRNSTLTGEAMRPEVTPTPDPIPTPDPVPIPDPSPIPEPSGLILLGAGLIGLAAMRRHAHRRSSTA